MIGLDAFATSAEETGLPDGAPAKHPRAHPSIEPAAVEVAHVADYYNRYPGEVVTFYTRLATNEPVTGLSLRLSLPAGLELKDYRPPAEQASLLPSLELTRTPEGGGDEGYTLVWPLPPELPAGIRYDYQVQALIGPTIADTFLTSQARVTGPDGRLLAGETIRLEIRAKSRYLRYLPAFYEQDDFMGRFLMIFESMWAPVDGQIEGLFNYFDPRMTPAYFLPWLASWVSLELVEVWPEARLRELLRWAIPLHRSRGTRQGLLKYLELFTGQPAADIEIIEDCAENFVLGDEALLSPALALGDANLPYTFTVILHLPPIEAETPARQEQLEELRRRSIEAIIERQKPAQTVHTLKIEPLRPKRTAHAETKPSTKAADDALAAQAAIWS